MRSRAELSVVTAIYQAEAYLEAFYTRMSQAASRLSRYYELIFVHDGATDGSLAILHKLQAQDARIIIVELSRNYGQHAALWAGLHEASGNRVFVIDCDLEEAPECLARFWQEMDAQDADIVFGQQATRRGGGVQRLCGGLFYRFLALAAGHAVVPNVLMVRLMTRGYTQALLQFPESDPRLTILAYRAGFRQVVLPVEKLSKGSSCYTLGAKLAEACDYTVGLTSRPLRLLFFMGAGLLGVSLLAALWLMFARVRAAAWLFVALGIATGLVLTGMGVLGLYLARVLQEVRRQPLPLVRQVLRAAQA